MLLAVLSTYHSTTINLLYPLLNSSDHQYGFHKGSSTDLCTWTLSETINFFKNLRSSVFLCLLDLSKAFDMVKLNVLFQKLCGKFGPVFPRFLYFSYVNQERHIYWSGVFSSSFTGTNGVRQGSVASPTFSNSYIYDLFEELRQ